MQVVLLLFLPLSNICIQKWGVYILAKAYRNTINPFPISEWRTGKPAMVTLKIQLNYPMLHDTTLWANIFMHSHLGCGTDPILIHFSQVSQIFQRYKSDANIQEFEKKVKFDMSIQSTFKTIEILTKAFCTSGPNLVVLAWTGDELSCRQAQNWISFDFEVEFVFYT